jgi:hypothetical protein
MKFFLVVHSPENTKAAMELVRKVVHDVVAASYVEEEDNVT